MTTVRKSRVNPHVVLTFATAFKTIKRKENMVTNYLNYKTINPILLRVI